MLIRYYVQAGIDLHGVRVDDLAMKVAREVDRELRLPDTRRADDLYDGSHPPCNHPILILL